MNQKGLAADAICATHPNQWFEDTDDRDETKTHTSFRLCAFHRDRRIGYTSFRES